MNYFEHHIGDYDADTAHLTWAEDMAYTRLMRLYYRKEQPIPTDIADACRLIRATTKEQKQAVADVLKEFFVLTSDGWHQDRCDSEIAIYKRKVEHNRVVGRLGGRPRKKPNPDDPNGPDLGSEPKPGNNPPGLVREPGNNPLQSPDPIRQANTSEPRGSGADSASDAYADALAAEALATASTSSKATKQLLTDPAEIIFGPGLAYLVGKGVAEPQARSFLGRLRKTAKDDAKVVNALRACMTEKAGSPIEYLSAAVMPKAGKHTGFAILNYTEGIDEDGSFA